MTTSRGLLNTYIKTMTFHVQTYTKIVKLMWYDYWVSVLYGSLEDVAVFVGYQGKMTVLYLIHDDAIKGKHFPCYWPFVRGIRRSPVNSPHAGQWRGALMFSLICAWINGWVNNGEAGDLRRNRVHYDVTMNTTIWNVLSWEVDHKWYNLLEPYGPIHAI